MQISPKRVETVVLACCCLHNLLRQCSPHIPSALVDYEDPATHVVQPGVWREGDRMTGLQHLGGNTATKDAKEQRDVLRDYYRSPAGEVPWQNNMI